MNKNFWKFIKDVIEIKGIKLNPHEFYYKNKTDINNIYRKKRYDDAARPGSSDFDSNTRPYTGSGSGSGSTTGTGSGSTTGS